MVELDNVGTAAATQSGLPAIVSGSECARVRERESERERKRQEKNG